MGLILSAGRRAALARAVAGVDWTSAAWVYFGLGHPPDGLPDHRRIDARAALGDACLRLRDAYIAWVAACGADAPPGWETAAVSEKNPYISRTFLYAAVTDVCRHLGQRDGLLIVVASDPGLREALRAALGADIVRSFGDGVGARLARWAREIARRYGNLLRYGLRHLGRIAVARWRYRLHGSAAVREAAGHPSVAVTLAWVDRRSVDLASGAFHDSDFADLMPRFADAGARALVVPIVLADAPFGRVAAYAAGQGVPTLWPHAFLRMRDVVAAVAREMVSGPNARPARCPKFNGESVESSVRRDLREEWLGARRLEHVLQDDWLRRVAGDGIRITRAIYPFENHAWERAFVASMRRWHPTARLVGHQPNGLPRMLLNYFIDERERSSPWLPDAIITNGPYATEALIAGGYGADRIRSGGGLRQPHVRAWLAAPWTERPVRNARPCVIVTPSIGLAATHELIEKCAAAFAGRADLDVVVKLHPGLTASAALAPWGGRVPGGFRLVTEPLGRLLGSADMLVYNDGTFPAAEALAAGVPVCSVDLDYGVPLDAIDAFPEVNRRARTAEALAAAVAECLARDAAARRDFAAQARRVAAELVGAVDEAVLAKFLSA